MLAAKVSILKRVDCPRKLQTLSTKSSHCFCIPYIYLSNYLSNDTEKIQKRALSIIYPITSYKNTMAQARTASLKQCQEDAWVNFAVRVCPDNPIFPSLQIRFFHLFLDSCTWSNQSFTTLPSNTDHFANFVTIKYATI